MKNLLLILLLNIAYLNAEDVDVTKPLRIHQLIPRDRFAFTLGVDPSLPQNYVCLQDPKESPCPEWLYWGPEEVLKAYFNDPKSLKVPIIRARLSLDVTQNAIEQLKDRSFRAKVESKFEGCIEIGNWGNYPFFKIHLPKTKEYNAYVGLNYDNNVLQIALIVPAGAETAALKLWNNFFNKTQPLAEPLLFKANGQEMHTGYTIVDVVGRSAKVVVERRKSDKKIRLAVIPIDKNIQFNLETVFETKMGSQWHFNEPMLKISGSYVVDNGWVHLAMVTSVLIAEVDEFSSLPDKEAILIQEFEK